MTEDFYEPSAPLSEQEIVERIEAENTSKGSGIGGLVLLVCVPVLLVALPLLALMGLRRLPSQDLNQIVAAATFEPNQPAYVQWSYDLNAALQQAQTQNKKVLIDFYTDWCGPCQQMDAQTYPHPAIVNESRNFVMLKINCDAQPNVAQRYSVNSYPTTLWTDAQGNEITREVGGVGPAQLLGYMKRYR